MNDDFQAALAVALRRMQTSDRYESEVRGALAKFSPETVDQVVTHLRERRVLNDQRLTETFVDQNHGRRAVGAHRVRAKLERRGAPTSEIDAAVQAVEEGDSDRASAVLAAKYPNASPADRSRAGRFLYSRGFGVEAIEQALGRYFSEAGSDPFST